MHNNVMNNKKRLLVSVDTGKFACKSYAVIGGIEKRNIFESKVLKGNDAEAMEAQGKSFRIEFEDEKEGSVNWIFGDVGAEYNLDDSKDKLEHKMSLYIAIANMINEYRTINGYKPEIIDLVIGCPMNNYKDASEREKYIKYMINGNGHVEFNMNGDEYKFEIDANTVFAMPEAVGVTVTHAYLFKSNRRAVIDLGGKTMNFCIIGPKLIPEIKTMMSRNIGSHDFVTDVHNELSKTISNLTREEVEFAIEKEELKGHQSASETIRKMKENRVLKVFNEIKQAGHEIARLDPVFVGGTSLKLQKQIRKLMPDAIIVDDCQFTNAIGNYKVAARKFKKHK